MFGIPLATLITYLMTYGPAAIKVLQVLGPIIAAAAPQIEALMAKGMTQEQATSTLTAHVAVFDPESARIEGSPG